MAGSSLLTLIDDIAAVLDDVAVMTKVAAKKTAGVLGDDLALNAEQVTGVRADRELPVVWAVFKGSTLNKVILVPAALAISAVAPWLVTPLLMLGGGFLCYEGFEKVYHKLFHKDDAASEAERGDAELEAAMDDPEAYEKAKIKGAIRTDFVLSAEIIVIALGTVAGEPFTTQLGVLVAISAMMNIGVYGLVAGIVKLDDLGLALSKKDGAVQRLGEWILTAAPIFMKGLSIVGTAAMFLVGGGILAHGIPGVEGIILSASEAVGGIGWLIGTLLNGVVGIIGGGILVGASGPVKALFAKKAASAA